MSRKPTGLMPLLCSSFVLVVGCGDKPSPKHKVEWCGRIAEGGFVLDGVSVRAVSCATATALLQEAYGKPAAVTEPAEVEAYRCTHVERRDQDSSTMRCTHGRKAFRWAVRMGESCAARNGSPVGLLTKRGLTCDEAFAVGKLVLRGSDSETKFVAGGYRCTRWSYGGTEFNHFCDGPRGAGIRFTTGF